MSAKDLEKAKAYLQRKGPSGVSVYDHLSEVLQQIVTERPEDGVDIFEHMSALVKQSNFTAKSKAEGGESKLDAAAAEDRKAWADGAVKLFSTPEGEPAGEGKVQDVTIDSTYLEWAGVSLGRTETFRLHLSMKQLAFKQPVEDLRFWGKILGTGGDYYVVEGTLAEEAEPTKDSAGNTTEEPGVGVNKFAYWVCGEVGGDWVRLPHATPEQVAAARGVRRFFSGSLEASVPSHPPFPGDGLEKHWLRAQIALISAASVVSPRGLFEVPDEEAPFTLGLAEEFKAEGLNELGNWNHHVLPVNVLGRCTANPAELDEEGEPIEDPDRPEDPAALNDLEEGDWSVRGNPVSGLAEGVEPGLSVLRNLRWPGAVTVGVDQSYVNVYVGYGQPHSDVVYAPSAPAATATEYNVAEEEKEFREQTEVTEDPDAGKPEGEEGEGEEED